VPVLLCRLRREHNHKQLRESHTALQLLRARWRCVSGRYLDALFSGR
jgi:hypothetical protein